MKISIFGLGYVGCVSLGCLAKNGNEMIGVDVNEFKVDLINKGKPTIVEKEIDSIIGEQFRLKRIRATNNYVEAVKKTDVSIICVGTPSTPEGHLNLDYIFGCAQQIGDVLKRKKDFHIVVIRSTVLPGTNLKVSEVIEKESGKKRNIDFAVVSNPEFLREGTAVADYYNPPLTVLGGDNEYALKVISDIYSKVNGPIETVSIHVAEIIKYVNNSFHALKIVFANEVGNICKKMKIDSHEVMRIFCMDKQLNISPYYFKPGFAYGGSCLPKDLKALKTLSHDRFVETPVLNSIELSNSHHKDLTFNTIVDLKKNKIGFIGLSFKAGTDDLRYSPSVEVIEKLIGKGKQILIYDSNVHLSKLIGANKSYIEETLPHISSLLINNLNKVIDESEVLVIPNKIPELNEIDIPQDKIIIDLCRVENLMKHKEYNGINW
jgi:GDP-mannose 6-dehydrogenase